MPLSLAHPKHLEFANPRLNLAYWVLLLLALLTVQQCGFFIHSEVLAGTVQMSVRVSHRQELALAQRQSGKGTSRFCDFAKAPLHCSVANVSRLEDTYSLESSTSLLAFSSLQESSSTQSAVLVPSFDELQVEFDYAYRAPDADDSFATALFHGLPVSGSHLNATTVVLDHQARVVYESALGWTPVFSIKELLAMAGTSNISSERVTGMELLLRADCFSDNRGLPGAVQAVASSGSLVCVLSLQRVAEVAEQKRSFLHGSSTGHSAWRGLRIRCESGIGRWSVFSWSSVYVHFNSLAVWLTIPRYLMLWFIVNCLGLLSDIYREAVFERFSIETHVAGMAARMMVASFAFSELADDEKEKCRSISRDRLEQRLSGLCGSLGVLSEQEMQDMISFCHQQLRAPADPKSPLLVWLQRAQHGFRRLGTFARDAALPGPGPKMPAPSMAHAFSVALGKPGPLAGKAGDSAAPQRVMPPEAEDVLSDAQVVNSDMFSLACCSSETLKFRSVVSLFSHTPRSALERLFTTSSLQAGLARAKSQTRSVERRRSIEVKLKAADACLKPEVEDVVGTRRLDKEIEQLKAFMKGHTLRNNASADKTFRSLLALQNQLSGKLALQQECIDRLAAELRTTVERLTFKDAQMERRDAQMERRLDSITSESLAACASEKSPEVSPRSQALGHRRRGDESSELRRLPQHPSPPDPTRPVPDVLRQPSPPDPAQPFPAVLNASCPRMTQLLGTALAPETPQLWAPSTEHVHSTAQLRTPPSLAQMDLPRCI